MIRIAITDDHPVVRQGIRQVLARIPDLRVVAEASNGAEAVAVLAKVACDVLLLDLTLPDVDGLELLRQLVARWPRLAVLIVTMHAEDEFAVRALRAGARGYLTKDSPPTEMVRAIRLVAEGKHYVSAAMTERLAGGVLHGERLPHERLSDREYQIFRMIAAGQTSRQIAGRLTLSIKTIATHRARILEKMEMHTSAELATYAVRHHLTD